MDEIEFKAKITVDRVTADEIKDCLNEIGESLWTLNAEDPLMLAQMASSMAKYLEGPARPFFLALGHALNRQAGGE